jgi:hypothetical protein
MSTPKFDIDVELVGHDGNAFSIMGRVTRALRKAGATREQIDEYTQKAMSGDYDNLLRVTMETVNVL